ncbi:uncharacterized protein TNCV_1415871 [Trichonephila clavipes]|nr:uncharacterized protein TNCV_1415871 [Trichonephila clavipes]
MAQRQNLRRCRITCWGFDGAGHLRSSCPRINKDRNIDCWECGKIGHVRSNCPQVNQEDPFRTNVTESKKVCSNRKRSTDENGDVRSKRLCSESSKNLSNSLRVEKKFGVIDPVVRQVTTPSTSELDPWSDDSAQKAQLARHRPFPSYNEALLGSLGLSPSEKWCFYIENGSLMTEKHLGGN